MTCGCTENKDLNKNKDLNQYKLSLESMQTLSIEEITSLYRQGYRLEGAEYITIESMSVANPSIKDATGYYSSSLGGTWVSVLFNNPGTCGWIRHFAGDDFGSAGTFGEKQMCYPANVGLLYKSWYNTSSPIILAYIKMYACNFTSTDTCNQANCAPGTTAICTGASTITTSIFGVAIPQYTSAKPNPPTNVQITIGDRQLTLSWTPSNFVDPVTLYGVFDYYLEVYDGVGNGYDGYVKGNVTSYTFQNLTNGTQYTCTIRASSRCDEQSTIVTMIGTPIAPCNLTMSSVTCPSSPINQGSSGNITAFITIGTGISPFIYKLYVDGGGPVATSASTPSEYYLFSHIFNETIGPHTYRVDVVDSCIPPKTVTGSCTTTIQAALGTITFNVTSAGPLSGVAISVDDVPRGTTDGSGILTVPNLTVGATHTYITTKSGYNTISSSTVLDTTAKTVPISMTLTPPPIAISIVPNKTSCTPLCDVSIDITWRNDAVTDTIFVPSMKVDNVTISPAQYPSQTLGPGLSTTKTFTVLGLTAGDHTICPDPN